jgi:hypothetical protein
LRSSSPESGDSSAVDVRNFRDVIRILRGARIFFWLDQGSLLGAVRDRALIPWDSDIDLSSWKESFDALCALQSTFEADGFYFEAHEYKDCVFLARGGGRTIEIAAYAVDGDVAFRYNALPRNKGWERTAKNLLARLPTGVFYPLRRVLRTFARTEVVVFRTPAHFFAKFDEIDFLGCTGIPAPADVSRYLEFKYGQSWRTPVRTWNYSRDDGSVVVPRTNPKER